MQNVPVQSNIPIVYKDLAPRTGNLLVLGGLLGVVKSWKGRYIVLKDGILFSA